MSFRKPGGLLVGQLLLQWLLDPQPPRFSSALTLRMWFRTEFRRTALFSFPLPPEVLHLPLWTVVALFVYFLGMVPPNPDPLRRREDQGAPWDGVDEVSPAAELLVRRVLWSSLGSGGCPHDPGPKGPCRWGSTPGPGPKKESAI